MSSQKVQGGKETLMVKFFIRPDIPKEILSSTLQIIVLGTMLAMRSALSGFLAMRLDRN